MQFLLDQIAEDIRQLPPSAVQLVGALVALQDSLPPALQRFLMDQLAQRADMSVVSPAAEAVMRLSAFSAYSDMRFAELEIRTQLALLKSIAMQDKVLVAAAFMGRLAERVEAAFCVGHAALLQTPAALGAPSLRTPLPDAGPALTARPQAPGAGTP